MTTVAMSTPHRTPLRAAARLVVDVTAAVVVLGLMASYLRRDFGGGPTLPVLLGAGAAAGLAAAACALGLAGRAAAGGAATAGGVAAAAVPAGLAYILCFYASAKMFELQFGMDPATAARPAGELTGFERAWAFFGHSPTYGYLLAGAEYLAAALLLARPTRTTGGLVAAAILANVVAIDFLYGVEVMKYPALALLAMAVAIVGRDAGRVLAFALGQPVPARAADGGARSWRLEGALALVVVAAVVRDIAFFAAVPR